MLDFNVSNTYSRTSHLKIVSQFPKTSLRNFQSGMEGDQDQPTCSKHAAYVQPSNMDRAKPSSTFLGLASINTSEIEYPMQNVVPQGMTLKYTHEFLFQNNSVYLTSALFPTGLNPRKN